MDSIFGKIKKSDVFSEENRASYITAVALMSLFTFKFLGAEFLFGKMEKFWRCMAGIIAQKCECT